MGRDTAIKKSDEMRLIECVTTMEKWGWGLTRAEIRRIVGDYVNQNNIKTPFKDGYPGEDWFLGFCRRHNLSIKKPQSVEYSRKKCLDPKLLGEIWLELKPEIICNGFRKGGIYPFNSDVIPKEKFDPLAYKRWEHHQNLKTSDQNFPENNPVASTTCSFEELLLATVKQNKPIEKKPKRKVCAGAEVITSEEALVRLQEKENATPNIPKKKNPKILKKHTDEEEIEYNDSDDEDFGDEMIEDEAANAFMNQIEKPLSKVQKNDWVLVRFTTKKNSTTLY
ncbi:hypothetical protein RN001_016085 [Aquatica leii]|uniref:HTH CENPB-type domain-containing protein n=1 Tax=Aquatica leii TaxID=1421715 RepID=A0AAN7NYX3_9COLE|nr:hypothetical protein RN001_016085 [Aquatica leii]